MRGSFQSHGLHGAEAQGVASAARNFLDGQAGLEIAGIVFGDVGGDGVGLEQFVDEVLVLLAVERAIEIVVGAVGGFAVAGGPEGDGGIDGLGVHDGADAVVEVEAAGAGEAGDLLGERTAGEGTAGDDPDGVIGEHGDFVAAKIDEGLGGDGGGDFRGEDVAIDGECVAAGYARLLGAGERAGNRGGAVPL